jgi:hypothetical protein
LRPEFPRRWTFVITSPKCFRLRRARYSVWTGTMARSAAIRAFTVKTPRLGGQSKRMKSYSSRSGERAVCRVRSQPISPKSSASAPARSKFAGMRKSPATWVGRTAVFGSTSSRRRA